MGREGLAIDPKTIGPGGALWLKVRRGDATGCWTWAGTTNEAGYGYFKTTHKGRRRVILAHRYAYALTHGGIDAGWDVLHSCDNPPCCNPAHLRLGNNPENMEDRTQKGRSAKKLSAADAQAIRLRYVAGERQKDLAAAYGVHQTMISCIVRGANWTNLQDRVSFTNR